MNRIIEILLYRIVVPFIFVLAFHALFKAQSIRDNEITRYNWSLRK